MAEERPKDIKLYKHIPNSGIVHMPGRRFPAVAIQGDSLSTMLTAALSFLEKAKKYKDEDMFYDALNLVEQIAVHLELYELVLKEEGFDKPYAIDISKIDLDQEFEDT